MSLFPRLVAGVAALQVGVAAVVLLALPATDAPPLPALVIVLIGAYSVGAGFLLGAGRADRRAVHLGVVFATVASTFVTAPTRAILAGHEGVLVAAGTLLNAIRVEALAPYFLWCFVSEFPRVGGADPWGRVARTASAVALAMGLVLIGIHAALLFGDTPAALRTVARFRPGSSYWLLVLGASLPALGAMALRDRRASRPERRRVRVLLFGIAIGTAPIMVFSLLDVVGLMENPQVFAASRWVAFPALIAVPFLTAYAVLVHRALDIRLIVRKALQYALARYTLVGAAATPLLIIVAFVFARRGAPVGTLFAGADAIVLAALSLAAGLALRGRERLVSALDRRFFREQHDARRILRALVDEAREAHSAESLSRLLVRQLDRALHPTVVSVLLAHRGDGWLMPDRPGVRPIARDGPLVTSLARYGAVRDLGRMPSEGPGGAGDEAVWLTDHGVHLVAPLLGRTHTLLGVVALGEKRSELPYTSEDRELIAAVVAAASASLENLTLFDEESRRDTVGQSWAAPDPPAGRECTTCGAVQWPDESGCRGCGGAVRDAQLPAVLGGKFRVRRALGAGGGGSVHLAEDETLGRPVAVKGLHTPTAESAIRLQREARSLAATSHPHLAVIYGTEKWRGRTFLVLEYLAGGSLAGMLESGPLDAERSVRIGVQIADALAHLHAQGILHRDVKPSNVGFTDAGAAKLLDFGLAHIMDLAVASHRRVEVDVGPQLTSRSGPMPGTLPYSSPEAVGGRPPDPRDDLWGLSVLVCEAISGVNPYRGRTAASTLARIAGDRPEWPSAEAFVRAPGLEALLRRCLSADQLQRPRSAGELRDALAAIRVEA